MDHPTWHPPRPAAHRGGLRLLNTLTGSKDLFTPIDPAGKEVGWYICGPTVYDKSHLGHARTFLAFDIIRRIMEDYFGFSVKYVMNITDVDDKIILRARRNHVAKVYREGALSLEKVRSDAKAAFDFCVSARRAAVDRARADLGCAVEKDRADAENRVQETEMKLDHAVQAARAAEKAAAEAAGAGSNEAGQIAAFLQHAVDYIAEHLDQLNLGNPEGPGRVTDHTIFREHARHFEREFHEDMEALGLRPPTILTRVTEYVPQIVEYVKKIVDNGFGYVSNGSVYFSTPEFSKTHDYCKLAPHCRNNEALLAEGEGALTAGGGEKRNKADFALWKKSKPGEPSWDSPWGPGRPGWHIECSVMAGDHLGANFDIHSGGEDLKFPHHDNELAQAEAHDGTQQWVNYFLHAGHLHIEGLKMSKSLKNFITIRQALEMHTARQIRLLFLLSRWDRGLNFSHSAMEEVRDKEKTLSEFFLNVAAAIREQAAVADAGQSRDQADRVLGEELKSAVADVHSALEDSFDTPAAVHRLLKLVSATNIYLRDTAQAKSQKVHLLRQVSSYVHKMMKVFGLIGDREPTFSARADSSDKPLEQTVAPFIDTLAKFRDTVRKAAQSGAAKDVLMACDAVRDADLPVLGVRLEDRANGTSTWKLVDPDELRREREAAEREREEKRLAQLRNQLTARSKALDLARQAAVSPSEMFRDPSKYSEWDEKGLPTKDANGAPLSKSAGKDAKKWHEKQEQAHKNYLERLEKEPNFVADLEKNISDIKAQLGV